VNILNLIADANAFSTQNASVRVKDKNLTLHVLGLVVPVALKSGIGASIGEGHILQGTLPPTITDRTVQRVVKKKQLEVGLPSLVDLGGFGEDLHPFRNLGDAAHNRPFGVL
jgi:hypothetical protein